MNTSHNILSPLAAALTSSISRVADVMFDRGARANAAPLTTIEHSDFLARTGHPKEPVTNPNSRIVLLQQHARLLRALRAMRAGNAAELDGASEASDDDPFASAAAQTISKLRRGGKSGMETWLSQKFDVLEQHSILRDALSRTTDEEEKKKINEALSDLINNHEAVINHGIKKKNEFVSLLSGLNDKSEEGFGPADVLRIAMESGKEPPDHLQLAHAIAQCYTTKNFAEGLAKQRARVGQASPREASDANPKLWFSVTHANSFHLVQSTFAIAEKLRGDLNVEKIVPKKSTADGMFAFMEAAKEGNQDPVNLFRKIVGPEDLPRKQVEKAFQLIRLAVEKLPNKLWSDEKTGARAKLLSTLAIASCSDLAPGARFMEIEEVRLQKDIRSKL